MKNLSEYFLCLYLKLVGVLRSEKGQTLIEYALIIVLIALVVYLMLFKVGGTTCNVFSKIESTLASNPVQ
jgi:Flp pilus assembly pilin Flp